MVVMGLGALTIGAMIFIGLRKLEVTLVGAVASMVFALFALREALPAPPRLGIRANILVFFWTELAAAVALCLFMIASATGGSSA